MMIFALRRAFVPILILVLLVYPVQAPPLAEEQAESRPEISGDPTKPRRHFRVRNAAELGHQEAENIYRGLLSFMTQGYRAAGDPIADTYADWSRFNTAPYRSATHGQRFVNNYANEAAQAYGRYEEAGIFPPGAIIAKDSFSVTREGEVRPGPLFVMEKMEPGFNYVSGDWRYIMIMPDGELFGMTRGVNAERVEYCIGCHLVQEERDHLFFLPEDYRVTP
jgi:hypothetical protein